MSRAILGLAILALVPAALGGCGPGSDATAAASTSAPQEPGLLKLEPGMAKEVRVEAVEAATLPVTLKVFGKIQFNEDRLGIVLAPLPGQVSRLTVRTGDAVAKGDVLFQISSRDIAGAVGDYIDARKDLELSEKTLAMTRDLFDSKAAAGISLKQAENDFAKCRGRAARTMEILKTLGVDVHGEEITSQVPVRSPLQGTLIERKVTEGQYVTGDATPLLTIADLSTVWIVADLFERDLPRVRAGEKAEVSTIAYPDVKFQGRVERISDVVDPNTRTIKVRLLVANSDGRLKPEMFAAVTLFLKDAEPALTIPAKAAFTEGGRQFVYVERKTGEFQLRPVEVQPGPEGRLKVLQGLAAGERVAGEDVMLLRAQESSGGGH
jgi:cobalt-zinc-cadmium efflux system membrane fusion protein